MKKAMGGSILLVLLLSFTGCALIFKGERSQVRLNSEPANAEVFINGQSYGRTPLRLELKNNQDYVIEFRKPGFQPVTRRIENHIGAGWIVLDVICGLVPVVIDAVTGAWYDLDQHYVNVILERQQPKPLPFSG